MSFQSERTCTSGRSRRQLTWFDRSGKSLGVFGAPDDTQNALSLSADGRLAAVVRTVAGNTDVWLIDGTRTSRFTFADATDAYPAWSPDSRQIAFSSNRTGAFNPWVTSSSGAGEERQLLQSPQTSRPTDWSKDGRFLATVMVDSGTPICGPCR